MLVLFDFDGTLVDSEYLWAQATVEVLAEEEMEMTIEDFSSSYAGMRHEEIIPKLEEEFERGIPHDIVQRVEDRAMLKIEKVEALAGAHEMLDQLDYARCICSNSSSEDLETNMRRTDLWDRFRPYVYSSIEVGTKAPKPDPNVFLHAATVLDVDPKDCIVIEDSFHGTQAGVSAGMRVIGFIGGGHTYPGHGEHLMDAGAQTVVRRLADLPATIEALKNWHDE